MSKYYWKGANWLLIIFIALISSGCQIKADAKTESSLKPPSSKPPSTQLAIEGWLAPHKNKLLDYDPEFNIYQFKVLAQKPSECSSHQIRNLLFMLDMLDNSPEDFNKKYLKMINPDEYEKMMDNVQCTRGAFGVKSSRTYPNVKKLIEENSNYSEFLPTTSKDNIEKIIEAEFLANRAYYPLVEENYSKLREFIINTIRKVENEKLPSEQEIFEASRSVNFTHLYEKIHEKLDSDSDLIIPIALGLNSTGTIEHATSLIARRKAGKWEFIFMDPLNWKLRNNDSYKKTLTALIKFLTNKDYRQKNLIRLYFALAFFDLTKENASVNAWFFVNRAHNFKRRMKQFGLSDHELIRRFYEKAYDEIGNLLYKNGGMIEPLRDD